MSLSRITAVAIVLALFLAAPSSAQIVVDHQPTRSGGPASDLGFVDMFGRELWDEVADDFTLAAPAEIRRVSAFGFYDLDNPPVQEAMRIRFYESRSSDGFPGNIIYEQIFDNYSRVPTGQTVFVHDGVREFLYTFDLPTPVPLSAAVPYWFEIVQVDDLTTTFRIEASSSGNRRVVFRDNFFPDWTVSVGSDSAFQLSTIPEPAVLVLLAIGAAFVSWMRSYR